ncbi:hypothetical protein [Natronorubrum aibiense]|uniref:DUF8159 domain-containing protein n=1 Tax=Natronorubrum aibiense TaxID=348826 RepID=A0A5P9P9P4_9EURY|nr:hypothetical protein [Natronorubrum aibiense]QFU84600.1 hypothetical protein GCU68_18855 [Natronorubrum aibiense]
MDEKQLPEPATGLSRRAVLSAGAGVGVGILAGCVTDAGGTGTETDGASEDDDGNDESDGDEEAARTLVEAFIDAIEPELSVTEWELNGMLVLEYTDSHGVEDDAEILGNAYADIVEQGFDRRAMPTALDDNEDVAFMVFLEPEWATAYLEGDLSEDAYYAEIIDSEH